MKGFMSREDTHGEGTQGLRLFATLLGCSGRDLPNILQEFQELQDEHKAHLARVMAKLGITTPTGRA
jgi:hypothetical protein